MEKAEIIGVVIVAGVVAVILWDAYSSVKQQAADTEDAIKELPSSVWNGLKHLFGGSPTGNTAEEDQ